MAGDWIKMRVSLPDEPEVIAIAAELDMDEDHVVGKLHRLWGWADQVSRDGHAAGVTEKWLDRYLRVPGFSSALQKVGWLVIKNEGASSSIQIPNFDVHNGKSGKSRALTTKRKQAERSVKPVTQVSRSERDKSVTRYIYLLFSSLLSEEEERNGVGIEVPTCLDTTAFELAWHLWEDHRRDIRKPLTETSIRQQLKKLSALGHDRAIAAIEHSVANGWQGIFEPSERAGVSVDDPRGNMAVLKRYLKKISPEDADE